MALSVWCLAHRGKANNPRRRVHGGCWEVDSRVSDRGIRIYGQRWAGTGPEARPPASVRVAPRGRAPPVVQRGAHSPVSTLAARPLSLVWSPVESCLVPLHRTFSLVGAPCLALSLRSVCVRASAGFPAALPCDSSKHGKRMPAARAAVKKCLTHVKSRRHRQGIRGAHWQEIGRAPPIACRRFCSRSHGPDLLLFQRREHRSRGCPCACDGGCCAPGVANKAQEQQRAQVRPKGCSGD